MSKTCKIAFAIIFMVGCPASTPQYVPSHTTGSTKSPLAAKKEPRIRTPDIECRSANDFKTAYGKRVRISGTYSIKAIHSKGGKIIANWPVVVLSDGSEVLIESFWEHKNGLLPKEKKEYINKIMWAVGILRREPPRGKGAQNLIAPTIAPLFKNRVGRRKSQRVSVQYRRRSDMSNGCKVPITIKRALSLRERTASPRGKASLASAAVMRAFTDKNPGKWTILPRVDGHMIDTALNRLSTATTFDFPDGRKISVTLQNRSRFGLCSKISKCWRLHSEKRWPTAIVRDALRVMGTFFALKKASGKTSSSSLSILKDKPARAGKINKREKTMMKIYNYVDREVSMLFRSACLKSG